MTLPDFNPNNTAIHGDLFPVDQINRGYGVRVPNANPSYNANGRLVNQVGEKIDFYIEEMEADFEMTGSTGQSRKTRQFFPHNIVQPGIVVSGIAPNNYQYNRLAAFIRASQVYALSGREFIRSGTDFRTAPITGSKTFVPSIQLIIRNGSRDLAEGFPYNGKTVKGIHRPWLLEGFAESIAAGGERFNHAPQFQFKFLVTETNHKANVGIWRDDHVAGNQLKSWMDVFKSRGKDSFIKDTSGAPAGTPGADTFQDIADAVSGLTTTAVDVAGNVG